MQGRLRTNPFFMLRVRNRLRAGINRKDTYSEARLGGSELAGNGRKEVKTMPQTGHTVPESGIYRNDCAQPNHKREIAISRGERFPPCSGCHRPVIWTLVRRTT